MSHPTYRKWLYLRKFDEAHARSKSKDYYDLIMAAGILRHLLLEDSRLADKANRDINEPLVFEVAKYDRVFDTNPKLVFEL